MHPVARAARRCLPLMLQRTVGAMVGHTLEKLRCSCDVLKTGLTALAPDRLCISVGRRASTRAEAAKSDHAKASAAGFGQAFNSLKVFLRHARGYPRNGTHTPQDSLISGCCSCEVSLLCKSVLMIGRLMLPALMASSASPEKKVAMNMKKPVRRGLAWLPQTRN